MSLAVGAAHKVVAKNPIVTKGPAAIAWLPVARHVTTGGFIHAIGGRPTHTMGAGPALL